jgi:hypothetical protein
MQIYINVQYHNLLSRTIVIPFVAAKWVAGQRQEFQVLRHNASPTPNTASPVHLAQSGQCGDGIEADPMRSRF